MREGSDDSAHGAFGERWVASQLAFKGLRSQEPAQETHGSARVPAIDGRGRRGEFPFATIDDDGGGVDFFDIYAEGAHCPDGGVAVFAREEVRDFAATIRERREKDSAVRDAFVARNRDFRFDDRSRFDMERLHGK